MQRGTDIHAILEAWALGAHFPNSKYGDRARSALPFVPRPVQNPEAAFFWTSHGVDWKGTFDLHYVWEPQLGIAGDYKTTSNAAYIMNEAKLQQDPQVLLYGDCILTEFAWVQDLLWLWIYMLPEPPARLTSWYLPGAREVIPQRVEKELAPAARKCQTLLRRGAMSLPVINETVRANPHTCNHIGQGCDYAQHCTRQNTKHSEAA